MKRKKLKPKFSTLYFFSLCLYCCIVQLFYFFPSKYFDIHKVAQLQQRDYTELIQKSTSLEEAFIL